MGQSAIRMYWTLNFWEISTLGDPSNHLINNSHRIAASVS